MSVIRPKEIFTEIEDRLPSFLKKNSLKVVTENEKDTTKSTRDFSEPLRYVSLDRLCRRTVGPQCRYFPRLHSLRITKAYNCNWGTHFKTGLYFKKYKLLIYIIYLKYIWMYYRNSNLINRKTSLTVETHLIKKSTLHNDCYTNVNLRQKV